MSASHPKAQPPDALELAATWASAAILIAMLAFLIWDASQPSRPPSFEASIESRAERGTDVYVTVVVRNVGDDAARAVEVRVTPDGGASDAEGHFTLEWVPGRSTRRGVAVLPKKDAAGTLRAEVAGYSEP